MTLRTLLIGPSGHGGEGIYIQSLYRNPPPNVEYQLTSEFHRGVPGAPCALLREVALNQIVHRLAVPDMGFRAVRLRERFDLVHVHAHPAVIKSVDETPIVMSEGSSSAVYLGEYLGWDDERLAAGYRRSRRIYKLLGIHDRLLALEGVRRAYVFSEWARRVNLRWGADPEKLDVIYPGFPTPAPVERSGRERFTFLFVGGDFERKGGFEVIEAFAELADRREEARLVIAGWDPSSPNPDRLVNSWVPKCRQDEAIAQLRSLEAAGRVQREAWVDHDLLRAQLYPNADAFVMPTYAEGFGFTNVEAMSFGLPVITSDVGPVAEILTPGESGLVVRPGDAGSLLEAMSRLIDDRQRTRLIGEAARREFEGRFSRERFRQALGDFYARALEG